MKERIVKFKSGAKAHDRAGKGRFDLIPPVPLKRLAIVYELGSLDFGDNNWQNGTPKGKEMDSTLRHINQYREGLKDEDHLARAVWHLFAEMYFQDKKEKK